MTDRYQDGDAVPSVKAPVGNDSSSGFETPWQINTLRDATSLLATANRPPAWDGDDPDTLEKELQSLESRPYLWSNYDLDSDREARIARIF